MNENELNYEKDLQIDHNALDIEWLEQAGLFMRYAEIVAVAGAEAKRAHENLKTIRSELIRDAWKKPELSLGHGIKPSDSKVEAYYRNHEDYQEAKQKQIDAEYKFDIMNIAKSAMYIRKNSLENLVVLHGQKYFAGPSIPRNLNEERKERQNEVKEKIKTRSKRRKN